MTEQEDIEQLKYYLNELGKAIPCDTGWGIAINEAYNMAISELEKKIPKKAILYSKKKAEIKEGDYVHVKCPYCGENIFSCFHYTPWNEMQKSHKYCKNCSQKLDWGDTD